ncbi:MAG TPA: hypothetical protein VIP28_13475 [Nocardioides sp.]
MKPSIGRIVHYKLSEGDVAYIQSKHQDRSSCNQASAGEMYPALVVRVWGSGESVNLQVFLDGDCSYWATSRVEGDAAGTWRWPERVA